MKPMDIIFIGAILVIVGGIVGAIGTRMQNKASSIKSDKQLSKIQELNDQNIILSNSLAVLSSQNSGLSDNISNLSGQNNKLILELSNARDDLNKVKQEAFNNTFGSMGGIIIPGSSYLKLFNDSKLPMYDVKIFITNYDALLNCDRRKDGYGNLALPSSCYHNLTKQYSTPILYGETVMDFPSYNIDKKKSYKVIVKIITKKGTYYQQLIHSDIFGTAFRILEPSDQGNYWKQYLNKLPEKTLKIKEQTFNVILEKSLWKDPVDWNKEFPLPVSFSLVD